MTRTFTLFAVISGVALGLNRPSANGADLKFFGDATLHSLQMIDEHEGWAVGDQGTVWHTMDGGTNWERQPSGSRATFTDVHMLDPLEGWIAARESVPYGPGSVGQILFTRDGGTRWHLTSRQDLSGLRKLQFVDENHGFAVGESTDQHPSGIFQTEDGGRRWTPWRGLRFPGWTTAHFFDQNHGILGGFGASFANYQQGIALSARCDWMTGTDIQDIAGDGRRIWVVGDRAQVFYSADQGKSWQRPRINIPVEIQKIWNFHSVCTLEDKVWIAGRPGSVILHSPDNGETWTVLETNSKVPLNDIQFTDADHGWGVGAFGTILATADGGKTWEVQRQSGCEAAVLWLNHDGANVPLTVVARYGGDEGYHNIGFAIGSPEVGEDLPSLASRSARFADGFRAVGGTTTDRSSRFALPSSYASASAEIIQRRWDEMHEGRGTHEILRELVLEIRMWCPKIIVTGSTHAGSNPEAEKLVEAVVREAFRTASDPTKFPEQILQLGLKEYASLAVYGRTEDAEQGTVRLTGTDFGPHLLESFVDTAEMGESLRAEKYLTAEQEANFQLLESRLEQEPRGSTLLAGTNVTPGSPSRRQLEPIDEQAIAEADQRAQKKTNLLAIASSASQLIVPEAMLAGLNEATEGLSLQQAGQTLFQIGRHHVESGRWETARAVFENLIETQPQHPLALEAGRWLIAYHASGEAVLRTAKPAVFQTQQASFTRSDEDAPTTLNIEGAERVVQSPEFKGEACGLAILLGTRLHAASPHLWSDPRLQLCLYSAYRRIGNTQVLDSHRSTILDADPKTRWAAAIDAEKWLAHPVDLPPRPIGLSPQCVQKPYLDGELDDAVWKKSKPVLLTSESLSSEPAMRTEVWLCHDTEHLYLAARCNVASETRVPEAVKRTSHDADVADQDRLELYLDIDRDYTSFYHLVVDQRGLVAADCWNDKTWNPQWFVARGADEKGWRIEAAIPLAELTDVTDLTNETWAFNLIRMIPGHGEQAFSHPAGVEVRSEGFTLLRFLNSSEPNVAPVQAN